MCVPANPGAPLAIDALHTRFLVVLPRIELHARIAFRSVRCAQRRDDHVAEVIALAWKWFVELARRGRDAAGFASVLAAYAARAVRSGRRACGQEKARDVLSPVAQRRHDFVVESLPISTRTAFEDFYTIPHGQREMDALEEALHDNMVTPVADQVCFRLDFPAWRGTRTERDRRVIDELMIGERTQTVARRFGLTASRVSQLRRAFFEDWSRFCGDAANVERAPAATERRSACPA